MRKLKLQVQVTIDGFVSGTNGEMDWMTFPWSQDIINYVKKITEPVDTILLVESWQKVLFLTGKVLPQIPKTLNLKEV